MEAGLCGNLGKESKETGAPWTCLCKPACLADLLMISPKASASQYSVSRPQVEEVNAAATGAAVKWGDNLPAWNGMSEANKLQTVGRTGLGHHGHTKDSTRFGQI